MKELAATLTARPETQPDTRAIRARNAFDGIAHLALAAKPWISRTPVEAQRRLPKGEAVHVIPYNLPHAVEAISLFAFKADFQDLRVRIQDQDRIGQRPRQAHARWFLRNAPQRNDVRRT